MEVKFRLKAWRVEQDEKTKTAKIKGEYALEAMGKLIATQTFNGDYSSLDFPFSGDLMQRVSALEKEIINEIQKNIT